MNPAPSRIDGRLIGVDFRIDCVDRDLALLLEHCYAARASIEGSAPPLGARLERRSGVWRIEVDGRESRDEVEPLTAVRVLNHELLQALMARRRDCFFVHAGVVVMGESVLALPGLSRAGKSTLTLALLRRGALFLSDEILALDPAGARLLAFPRAPKIRDECLSYFPDLAADFVGAGESRFLRMSRLTPPPATAALPLRALIAPRWEAGAGNRPRRVSPGRALLALTANALNFGAHREVSLDHLEAIVSGADCFELEWSDPVAAAEGILEAIGTGGDV